MMLRRPTSVPQTYGPQHSLVARFVGRLATVALDDWLEAARVVGQIDEEEWGWALWALRDAARRADLTSCLERAATGARGAAAPVVVRLERHTPRLTLITPSIVAAAAGAAGALTLRGRIPAAASATLYLPWADILPLHEIEPG